MKRIGTRALFATAVMAGLAGCVSTRDSAIDPVGWLTEVEALRGPVAAQTLRASTRLCQVRQCSAAPVIVMVFPKDGADRYEIGLEGKADPAAQRLSGRPFAFFGISRYDGRRNPPGLKYLAYLDDSSAPVCQGFFDSTSAGGVSETVLRCFDSFDLATGVVRDHGRQPSGPFKGQRMGTALLAFDGGVMGIIYGFDPGDLETMNLTELWRHHGGAASDLPFHTIARLAPPV
ncbi:MAG: hypothetical protein QNJ84_09400 [Alphaproteobacteria bacterium]|nr:hypothetical protein [Alphaproteobacteria bacterium]